MAISGIYVAWRNRTNLAVAAAVTLLACYIPARRVPYRSNGGAEIRMIGAIRVQGCPLHLRKYESQLLSIPGTGHSAALSDGTRDGCAAHSQHDHAVEMAKVKPLLGRS